MGNEVPGRPRRWRRTGCLVAVGLAVVLIGGCVGYRLHLRARINAELRAIRDAGYPVTLAELNAWYAVPEGENAADVLLAAFDLIVPPVGGVPGKLPILDIARLPPRTDPLPDDMKDLISEGLAANQEALALIHLGVRVKECRYPIDLTEGIAAKMGFLGNLQESARLLALQAVLSAEEGDGEAAHRTVLDCMGVARSLANAPVMTCQFVRMACYDLAADSLERVLARTSLTDSQLTELARGMEGGEDPELMTRAMAGARCSGLNMFDTVRRQRSMFWKSHPLYVPCGLIDLDELTYLDVMGEAVRITKLPFPEQSGPDLALFWRLGEVRSGMLIGRTVVPHIWMGSRARPVARLRTARTALAAERYRLAHGELPEGLADLVPEYLDAVPEDPFDGKPLRYKKLERGYVVYSIGWDDTDDGGDETPPAGARRGPDVTFIVER